MPATRASNRLKQTRLDFSKSSPINDTTSNTSTKGNTRSKNQDKPKTSPLTQDSPKTSLRNKAHSSPIKTPNGGLFGNRGNRRLITVPAEDASESEQEIMVHSSRRRKRVNIVDETDDEEVTKQGIDLRDPMILAEPDTSEDDMPNSSPMKKRGKAKPEVIELSSSEEEEMPVKRRLSRRIDLDEDREVSDEEEDDDVVRPNHRKSSQKRARSTSEEPEKSDSSPKSSKRKRLSRRADDIDEVKAELDDLGDSSPLNTPVKPSPAQKRRKLLDQLRRRRLRRQSGDNTIPSEEEEDEDAETEQEETYDDSFQHIYTQGNLDEYEQDDDFLVDDTEEDEDLIGEPVLMPFKFSRLATADLEELFSHAIDWLIQNKVNPGFDRHSDIYDTVWNRLNDEIQALATSKFKSSVWKRDFTVSLEARPLIEWQTERADELLDNCQACGRGNHPATYRVTLFGKPYDPDNLEEIESEEADETDYDYKGRKVPDIREWFLGKTCFDNAHSAHVLAHWKRSLNLEVLDYLAESGVFDPEQILEREGLSVAKKKKWCQQLVDEWDQDGKIGGLWSTYKDFVETARENKKGTFNY